MAGELLLQELTKVFFGLREQVVAVDHANLAVEEGSLVTLLGPSGCGKTTTLRMVGGFEIPTSGEIYLAEERITELPPQRRNTATVFQSYGLFPHMSVFENVAFGLKVRRFRRAEIRRKVEETLALVGLQGLGGRPPNHLSGGQQQRVALCRALVIEPQVLLFDEPLSNLDAKLRVETRDHIRKLQKTLGITSLYVTHDQAEAMAISDLIAVMHAGCIQQMGTPYEIYAKPANTFIADFIGRANFLRGRVAQITEGEMVLDLDGGDSIVVAASDGYAAGDRVKVVVRPEAVDLVGPGEGELSGAITLAHYTGSMATYQVELPDGEVFNVEVLSPQEKGFLEPGTEVGIRIHRKSVHVLDVD